MKLNIERLCRQITGANNYWPVNYVENSNKPPEIKGHSYYFTTLSGKTIVNHPSTYGWPTLYHSSTKRVVVGQNWRPKIPKNMVMRNDRGRLCLIRLSDKMDFHFPAKELLRKDFCSWARKEMAKNYFNRLKTKKLAKQFKNQVKNTYVNFNDARLAGNCTQGIIDWAKRKINLEKEQLLDAPWLTQVPAALLLRVDPDNKLVKNSINQAYLRETTISI